MTAQESISERQGLVFIFLNITMHHEVIGEMILH